MKKWVVLYDRNGQITQVWRYIDNEEEARKIYYLSRALDKYGAKDTLPIALNSRGGWHTILLEKDKIGRIIESEEKPELPLEEQYPVADQATANGWMSPEGIAYTCDSWEHLECAARLCRELNVPATPVVSADERLLENGWIKIYGCRWFGKWEKINDTQVSVLEKWDIKTSFSFDEVRTLMEHERLAQAYALNKSHGNDGNISFQSCVAK